MISLLEDCQNSALQCGLTMATSIYSFFVMIFAITCIVRMWNSNLNLKFESLPMLTTFLQSTLQFIQNLFVEDIRILLSSQFVQAITFSFIAMSFTLLYFRTNILKPSKNKFAQRRIIEIYALYQLAIIGLGAYVLSTLNQGDCSNWFGTNYYIPLSLSGVSMLTSIIFGIGLYKKIMKEHQTPLLNSQEESELVIFKKGQLHSLLKKQIQSILITYFFTVIAQVALNVVRELIIEDSMYCSDDYIFSTVKHDAEVFLFFFTIIEITPCLIVPYVFYYVPFAKANKIRRNKDLVFKFSTDETAEDGHSSYSSENSDLRNSDQKEVKADSIDVEEENGYKYVKDGIISSNLINNTRQSDESTMNTTFNTIKNKQFSNNSNSTQYSSGTNGEPQFNFSVYDSNQNNPQTQLVLKGHKSENYQKKDRVSVEETERQKRNTIAGMAAMDFGFKKSDYNSSSDEEDN